MIGGVAVLGLDRIGIGRSLHQGRIDDVIPRRNEQPFSEAALASLAGRLDQTGGFERAQMVADLLARHVEPLGQSRGGRRLREGGQYPPTDRRQRQQHRVQIVEQG